MANSKAEIFFHVGTGKTGSTFLQDRVFPKFKGIYYFPTNKWRNWPTLLPKVQEKKILVSREFDRQFLDEIKKFSSVYPNAYPIIVFRRQDTYIASQYRRIVKNGWNKEFQDFFDLEGDTGYFKHKELDYLWQIEQLKKHFNQEPIIFNYHDLSKNPDAYIQKFAEIIGAQVKLNDIDRSVKHSSYSEKQLKRFHKLSMRFDLSKRPRSSFGPIKLVLRLYMAVWRYGILYAAKYLPEIEPNKPLINPTKLDAIRNHFEDNWKEITQLSERIRDKE